MEFKATKQVARISLMDGTLIGGLIVNRQNSNLATYFHNGKMYRIHLIQEKELRGTIVDETPLPGSDLIP